MLAVIVRHEGSTPRTAGSKMIITSDGRGIGTIGGGLFESDVIARAAQIIDQGQSELMHFDLSGALAGDTDMICGGTADVLLNHVSPTSFNRDLFCRWLHVLEKNRHGCMVTVALPTDDAMYRTSHCLITLQDDIMGRIPLEPGALEKVLTAVRTADRTRALWIENALVVLEPAARAADAYLFGAGHVALPTARVAALVGFRVWVLDDRETFVDPSRFPGVHRVKPLDSFERAFADLPVSSDSYVIIFTRGHLHDKIVLAQALDTEAGYIGMIGSRRKCDTIYGALMAEGVDPSQIERVHCPIGLAIGAETPEEIAVSIVAEMIAHRSRKMP